MPDFRNYTLPQLQAILDDCEATTREKCAHRDDESLWLSFDHFMAEGDAISALYYLREIVRRKEVVELEAAR